MPYQLALGAEYVFAFSTGYVLNRFWTFSNQGRPNAALLKYGIAFLVAFALEWLVLVLVSKAGIGLDWGRIPSLVLATVASYLLQRYWAFQGH